MRFLLAAGLRRGFGAEGMGAVEVDASWFDELRLQIEDPHGEMRFSTGALRDVPGSTPTFTVEDGLGPHPIGEACDVLFDDSLVYGGIQTFTLANPSRGRSLFQDQGKPLVHGTGLSSGALGQGVQRKKSCG